MGCNCKKDNNSVDTKQTPSGKKDPIVIKGIILITKSFLFILASLLTAIIVIPFSIYMLFKVIFFNKGVDVTDNLKSIGNVIFKKNKNNDDEYDFDDEDEFELLDSE
tara:strand:- start:36 stop:356 length:321 start_codon:yes stop_codon:yes gene_type:complete